MYHIAIKPTTFNFTNDLLDQHPYGKKNSKVNLKDASEQHSSLLEYIPKRLEFSVKKSGDVPDLVFFSSAGLSLPRLPEPVVILPWMKFTQRRNELIYKKEIFDELNIKTVQFPGNENAPFEGQVETKWFHNGAVLVVGYGYRSSKESIIILQKLINEIYKTYNVLPPTLIPLKLKRYDIFHLQMAMLAFSETECIIQKNSIRIKDLLNLQQVLGQDNIKIIDSDDPFCLSSIVIEDKILTHELDSLTKKAIYEITKKEIIEFDMSEYEKAGGSVRALIFDLFDARHVKRKKYTNSNPSSPK